MANENVGARIKELRELNNLTHSELAKKLKVSENEVYDWECGKSTSNIDNINVIRSVFNISLNYLIDGKITESDKQALQPKKQPIDQEALWVEKCLKLINENNLEQYKNDIFPAKQRLPFYKKTVKKCGEWERRSGTAVRSSTIYQSVGIFLPYARMVYYTKTGSGKTYLNDAENGTRIEVDKNHDVEWDFYGIAISLDKLLKLDNYKIFEAVVKLDIPILTINKKFNLPNYPTRFERRELEKQPICAEDIANLNDLEFYKLLNDNLYDAYKNLSKTNKNRWHIIKLLIEKGMVIPKISGIQTNSYGYSSLEYEDDWVATEIIYQFALSKIK